MGRQVRIGIDVGGTFTDAVLIDNRTYEIIDKMKMLTTHEQGVAYGVVTILKKILEENQVAPEDVVFIAHGTTQATNALLEGDVANVGIIGMGTGIDARSVKNETNVPPMELSPSKYINIFHTFIDTKNMNPVQIDSKIDELKQSGAQVIVASEAYSVENPENELTVINQAVQKGLFATGGHEITQLYGLKMRTRTAVVNASLIPKMMETANMTEEAVKNSGIGSNLMIMRCDGGVMSIDEVRKRPILTMLSGLAAGVAGALMYEKISDGIFFEVGGTSIDISVIKNGKVMIKYAQVGGHKTYLQSLDVRTLGIAGGTMLKIHDRKLVDVGPRSAHIAGKDYECFLNEGQKIETAQIKFIAPKEGDPTEYAVIVDQDHNQRALTLAGAGDYAVGDVSAARTAWGALAEHMGVSADEAAKQAIKKAVDKLRPVIDGLIAEYALDSNMITLVGGGGSGAVLVPALADSYGFKWKIAKNAPYISTIGVALAMVREQIERSVINPTEEDIKRIRQEVIEKIVCSGAKEETVDVSIEIDPQKSLVRAIATGSTELRTRDLNDKVLNLEQLSQIARDSLGTSDGETSLAASTGRWHLFMGTGSKKSFLGLLTKREKRGCVMDREGVVRFKHSNLEFLQFKKSQLNGIFREFLDTNTTYSDANATLPSVYMFYREKMLDLTGTKTIGQLYSILELEVEYLNPNEELIAAAYKM